MGVGGARRPGVGGSSSEVLPAVHGQASLLSPEVSRNHICLMLCNTICLFLISFFSQVTEVPPQHFGGCRRKTGFSSSITHNCSSQEITHSSPSPVSHPGERLLPASAALHCVALGVGQHWQDSSYPLQCIQTHIVLLQCSAGISPLESWTSTKHSHCGCLPKSSLSWISQPQLRGAVAGVPVPADSAAGTTFCLLVSQYPHGQIPTGFLGIWSWIPQCPQRYFCSWMDAEFSC